MKIEYYIQTNKVGSSCKDYVEIPDEEWEDMSYEERDKLMMDLVFNMVEWGYEEIIE